MFGFIVGVFSVVAVLCCGLVYVVFMGGFKCVCWSVFVWGCWLFFDVCCFWSIGGG